jgi:hypothetical protein
MSVFLIFLINERIIVYGHRPNNLSLVCLYLPLYISFSLFGHFFFFATLIGLLRPEIIIEMYIWVLDRSLT